MEYSELLRRAVSAIPWRDVSLPAFVVEPPSFTKDRESRCTLEEDWFYRYEALDAW